MYISGCSAEKEYPILTPEKVPKLSTGWNTYPMQIDYLPHTFWFSKKMAKGNIIEMFYDFE